MSEKPSRERTRKLLKAKALGFTNSIAKLPQKERSQNPSGSFGDDYNALRQNVINTFPDLEDILPPKVNIVNSSWDVGNPVTREKYTELLTFCEQIYQLLSVSED